MARNGLAGALVGVAFGVILSWSLMADPSVVQSALRFEEAYLFLFFASAVATAAIGQQLVRRFRSRAVLTDSPIGWDTPRPQRHHVVGSVIFGVGWGVTGACPGPIAATIGQGVPLALFTFAGAAIGVYLFLRRESDETEPATDMLSGGSGGASPGGQMATPDRRAPEPVGA